MWDLIEPMPPAVKGGILTTGPRRKSLELLSQSTDSPLQNKYGNPRVQKDQMTPLLKHPGLIHRNSFKTVKRNRPSHTPAHQLRKLITSGGQPSAHCVHKPPGERTPATSSCHSGRLGWSPDPQVWVVSDLGTGSVGLWKNCTTGGCGDLSYAGEDALKAVQAFMILSIIFSVISLVVFVFQLFTMEKGNRFFLSGATMLVCWLCVMVGASIYTHHYANGSINNYEPSHHGYSFILTWICFCFSFIIGILYLVLRKK
uniref:Epithelial membrane protein 1 n=2 Tax=Bos mutus grunniens TaxID=30521 RepID=A0A8B9WAM7_BOSMU